MRMEGPLKGAVEESSRVLLSPIFELTSKVLTHVMALSVLEVNPTKEWKCLQIGAIISNYRIEAHGVI